MDISLSQCINAFENETEHIEISGIHIENSLKSMAIYGLLDIPKTTLGLERVVALKKHIDAIVEKLKDENIS